MSEHDSLTNNGSINERSASQQQGYAGYASPEGIGVSDAHTGQTVGYQSTSPSISGSFPQQTVHHTADRIPYAAVPPAMPPVVTTIPPSPHPPMQYGHTTQSSQAPVTSKKKRSKLLLIGIIVCVVAIVALITSLLLLEFKPFGLFGGIQAPKPTTEQIEDAYATANIPIQSFSAYEYIKTDGLDEPTISQFTAEDIETSEGNSEEIYCTADAVATYRNGSISATVPLAMRMTYDKDTETWKSGNIRAGNPTVKPAGPADLDAIEENLNNIIREYDPEVAAQFINCEVIPEATLNMNGGTAIFRLTKTDESTGETKSCAVNTEVSWNDSKGWEVTITSITGLDEPVEAPQPENTEGQDQPADTGETDDNNSNNNNNGTTNNSAGGGTAEPTMLLVCYSGDLVEVPGTVVFTEGHVLLHTDDIIRVEFNNKVYITNYFELLPGGAGVTSYTPGTHRIVVGAISANGTLPQAPLIINENYD